jgi:hypothetical protein
MIAVQLWCLHCSCPTAGLSGPGHLPIWADIWSQPPRRAAPVQGRARRIGIEFVHEARGTGGRVRAFCPASPRPYCAPSLAPSLSGTHQSRRTAGAYQVRWLRRGAPSAEDRTRVEAGRLYSDGRALIQKSDADSQRVARDDYAKAARLFHGTGPVLSEIYSLDLAAALSQGCRTCQRRPPPDGKLAIAARVSLGPNAVRLRPTQE